MREQNHIDIVRSAELGSFSAAARRLGLTPAAVSRNVAALEGNLGVRLFHRSTRSLTMTEPGERFLISIRDSLENLQGAIAEASADQEEPAGTLKVSMSPIFGIGYILPLLPEFSASYPKVRPEWMFENRQIDLIAEGYDVAIGGGFELTAGVISRTLAPAHIIAVAAPSYMAGKVPPHDPSAGREEPVRLRETVVVNDPAAMRMAALVGMGVTMIAKPDALPYLESGELLRQPHASAAQDPCFRRFRRGGVPASKVAGTFCGEPGVKGGRVLRASG